MNPKNVITKPEDNNHQPAPEFCVGEIHPAAIAWISFTRDLDDGNRREQLCKTLDVLLRRQMPDSSRSGILHGREQDLRQAAHLLLIERYLAGNNLLVAATAMEDLAVVEQQILRSCSAALSIAARQLTRQLRSEAGKLEFHGSYDELPSAVCEHPAQRQHLWQLPFTVQREVVFSLLKAAIKKKCVNPENTALAIAIVTEGISQAELARRMGVSRPAVHQRLAPVRAYLRRVVQQQELLGL